MTNLINKKSLIAGIAMLVLVLPAFSQGADSANVATNVGFSFGSDSLLVAVSIILLVPIYILARTLLVVLKLHLEKEKEIKKISKKIPFILLPFLMLTGSQSAFGQIATEGGGFGISTTTMIMTVILLEFILIVVLSLIILKVLKAEKVKITAEVSVEKLKTQPKKKSFFANLWIKINKFKPIEKEADLDTGHEYDGIRELDNVTPPWFTAGFIITIIFAVVYMLRYHVFKTAPLQIEEYNIEMAEAAGMQEKSLASEANTIDETNVTLLIDASDMEAGKKIFNKSCAVCHREDLGGFVGPNLTDEYWIHGGSVKEVFKLIKYGVREKGMVPWKDDLSPLQIAQVTGYILSMKGTNPPNPKEAQGELYIETAPEEVSDSTTSDTIEEVNEREI